MLTEDQVVDAVASHLSRAGWGIESIAHATAIGDDIVATKMGRRLHVEAKGGGSSKATSSRSGNPFTSGQVLINVGMATYRAMTVAEEGCQGAIAFPDTRHYRQRVDRIARALAKVGIPVFYVAEDLGVSVEVAPLA